MKHRIAAAAILLASVAQADVVLTPDETAQTLSFGPWPPPAALDPSNRVSGNPDAIALGQKLFNDPILSVDGALSCASCHDPQQAFTTPLPRAIGRDLLPRNTPSLQNLAGLRWYGWGGKSDNLWAANIHPMLADVEMAHTPRSLKDALSNSAVAPDYTALFGDLALQSPDTVLVNTAKTLAAYLETRVTERTAFDDFRDALDRGDAETAERYPKAAQRGLQLFLGRGNCTFCHNGPRFSNTEFHDAGVPYFLSETEVDPGRYAGLQTLLDSPYTLDGDWSDDPDKTGAWAVRNVRQSHADFGTFRTPGLRGVADTAPYMHDGSLPDLEAVIRHYDEIDLERMHSDGEAILRPLNLTDQEVQDLVSFLQTLSESPPE